MKAQKFSKGLLAVALAVVVLLAPFSAGAEEHPGKGSMPGMDHGTPAKVEKEEIKVPPTFSEAIAAVVERRDNIAKQIESGKLDGLHKEGEVIKKIAESLVKLASNKDSGVAKADIREINLTAKALAAQYEPLDEAGDSGKKEESQKVFDKMVKLIETLSKFVKEPKPAK